MANKSDLFNGNKPTGQLSRNGFDGSAARIFSLRPAICRPVFFQHTVPNSSYKINAADIVRTDALQTAAFLRGKHELDFYFVPYSMLYTAANNVILKRGDDINPGLTLNDSEFPKVDLPYLIQWASVPYILYRYVKYFTSQGLLTSFGQHISELLQKFFGLPNTIDQQDEHTFLSECVYNDISTFDYADINNGEDALLSLDFIGSDCLHLLATCGYGDYYMYFKNMFDNLEKWHYDQHPDLDTYFQKLVAAYSSLFSEHFDNQYDVDWSHMDNGTKSVNLISLCAYQKIWNDNYRDSVNDINSIYNLASSMDWAISTQFAFHNGQTILSYRSPLFTYLRPRQRMYKKDLSSGLYPSTQYGSESTLDFNAIHIINTSPNESTIGASVRGSLAGVTGGRLTITNNVSSDSWNLSNPPSAYDIKYTLALQKYREMLMRAGNRTKDVLRAEFGVRSAYIDEHYSRYLGSFDGALDINKVTATSESGEYSVGDLAGNVFSSLQGREIDFTCNDYGIVMAIMSFFPEPVHNAFGVDAMNMKTVSDDFYHEAFANLGLQPVSSLRFSPVCVDVDNAAYSLNPVTLGFAARDIEYKQNLDLAFDGFVTSPLFTRNYRNYISQLLDNQAFIETDGVYSNYVVSKPIRQTLSLRKNRAYFLPSCMDTLFKSYDDGDVASHHFQVALQINMTEVLPMPVTGMNL